MTREECIAEIHAAQAERRAALDKIGTVPGCSHSSLGDVHTADRYWYGRDREEIQRRYNERCDIAIAAERLRLEAP